MEDYMRLRPNYQRAAISIALAMAVATVFTFSSFAAPEVTKSVVDPVSVEDITGTLTLTVGEVTINGNAVQTGATVMNGSTVSTGMNGKGIIDLGASGRVEVGDNTRVTLTSVGSLLQIRSSCARTEVEAKKGSVNVISPVAETLAAGQKGKYDGTVELTSTGSFDVKVQCDDRRTRADGMFIGTRPGGTVGADGYWGGSYRWYRPGRRR
jgi:hypothetical protein